MRRAGTIALLLLLGIPAPAASSMAADSYVTIPCVPYPKHLTLMGTIGPGEYPASLSVGGVSVHWMHDGQRLYIGLSSPGKGYVAISWRKVGERGWANLIVAWVSSGRTFVEDRKTRDGDSSLDDPNVLSPAGKEGLSGTTVEFVYPLSTGDPFDPILRPGDAIEVTVSYSADSDDPESEPTQSGTVMAKLEQTPYPGSEAFRLVARSSVDAEMNSDLIESYFGGYSTDRSGGLEVVLGGPFVNPDWPSSVVEFAQAGGYYVGMRYAGVTLRADFGYKDYAAVIPVKEGGEITLFIGGVTRYGTRAGLMWAASNFQAALSANITLVYWRDKNGDGIVDPEEVRVEARA